MIRLNVRGLTRCAMLVALTGILSLWNGANLRGQSKEIAAEQQQAKPADLPAASAASGSLRVGVAEVDITPPVGFPMAGYYHERLAEGAIDPLKAKAMVFRDGQVEA